MHTSTRAITDVQKRLRTHVVYGHLTCTEPTKLDTRLDFQYIGHDYAENYGYLAIVAPLIVLIACAVKSQLAAHGFHLLKKRSRHLEHASSS